MQVIVEDVEAARREAGGVAIAVEKGGAWEDLAVARVVGVWLRHRPL